MTYEVGERYGGKGPLRGHSLEIMSVAHGWHWIYDHSDACPFSTECPSFHLSERTHTADGNPVEPDPPEDKLYQVTHGEMGAFVSTSVDIHCISDVIGRADGEGRICIGFLYGNDPTIHSTACKSIAGFRFANRAVFRHHSLVKPFKWKGG